MLTQLHHCYRILKEKGEKFPGNNTLLLFQIKKVLV